MKIKISKEKHFPCFNDLIRGEVFRFKDDFYMKTTEIYANPQVSYNAVDLCGVLHFFDDRSPVTVVDGTFVEGYQDED